MAVYILGLIFAMEWSGFILSSAFAVEGRCNATVFKTTLDLVHCVKNGINYDKTRRPKAFSLRDDPVVVNVSIEIASLNVHTGDMDFSLEFFFRQSWHDPNLAYAKKQAGGKKFIVFKADLIKDLWTPDTYIYGIRSIQTVQTENGVPTSEGLRISPNGEVLFSTRLSMTLSCSMNFYKFPMDKQTCFLNLTSFFYTDDDLHYEWGDLTLLDENIAHFELVSYQKLKTIQEFASGSYGRLTITFDFQRRINFYLLSWYLPATLIVALSWVSFWIDTKSTPARISLGTITILAMGSFLIGEQDGFPSVSYIRAIDIYLITCFVFVFGCMVEYAIVHYAKRFAEEREFRKKSNKEAKESISCDTDDHEQDKSVANGVGLINAGFIDILSPMPSQDIIKWHNNLTTWPTDTRSTTEATKKSNPFKSCKPRFKKKSLLTCAASLDEICRLIFPVTFLVLVITYCIIFGVFAE